MDWKTLFLNANGRIGPKDFWIAFAILFAIGLVLRFIPVIGQIAAILLIYPWVCVYSKRLHDMGKTGWLQLAPVGVLCVAIVIAMMTGGVALLAAMASGDSAAMMAAGGLAIMVLALALLICFAFLLWVGLTKGDAGENQYGPPPRSLVGGDAATPAA